MEKVSHCHIALRILFYELRTDKTEVNRTCTSKDGVTDSIVWTLLIKPHIVYSSETVSDSALPIIKRN